MRVLLHEGPKVTPYMLRVAEAPRKFKVRVRGCTWEVGHWSQGGTKYYELMLDGDTPVYGLVAMSHARH